MKVTKRLGIALSPILLASALAGCGGSDDSASAAAGGAPKAPESLVVVNPGGDWGDCQTSKFFAPFTQKTGIDVIATQNQTVGQIKAAVKAQQFTADLTYPGTSLPFGAEAEANLEKIDYSKIDKTQLVPGTFNDYAVSIDVFSYAIGYRTDRFDGAVPQGWADFFDTEEFPGKRAMPVDIDNFLVLYAALMGDGVAPDALLPLDVDRALAKLDTIKDDIVWYTSGSQGQQLLASGEVSMGMEFANRVTDMQDAALQWNGQIVAGDFMGVPKGDPNKDAAMDLLAFITSSEVNGTFTECAAGAPANTTSTVSPEVADDLPTSHLDGTYLSANETELATYAAEHFDEVTAQFSEWRGQ